MNTCVTQEQEFEAKIQMDSEQMIVGVELTAPSNREDSLLLIEKEIRNGIQTENHAFVSVHR